MTKAEYLRFRNQYIPLITKVVFVLESPPISGRYFYDRDGDLSEPLFRAMMKDVLEISPASKEEGLQEFASRRFFLIDATYTPINQRSCGESPDPYRGWCPDRDPSTSAKRELLYVLGRDKPGVGFGGDVFRKEFEDVFVFLVSEGLAERLDIFDETFDGLLKWDRFFVSIVRTGEFEAAFFRAQFKAFAFLGFKRLSGGFARGGAKPFAVLTPFDEEATARGPLNAFEGDVSPTLGGLDPPQDVDPCHSATPRKSGHYYGH
jgi:hypothetical protein